MPVVLGRIEWEGRWLALVGIHAPPPLDVCGDGNGRFLAAVAGWINGGRMREDRGPAGAGDPVVLLGDLNVTPFSGEIASYRAAGLADAYSLTSRRPRVTWRPKSWLPPIVRVDYILLGAGLTAADARILDIPGSDHRLVLADVRWQKPRGD
jgi:endonuclease/exonuclease/phosphatase family metal-dependent hydrolase